MMQIDNVSIHQCADMPIRENCVKSRSVSLSTQLLVLERKTSSYLRVLFLGVLAVAGVTGLVKLLHSR